MPFDTSKFRKIGDPAPTGTPIVNPPISPNNDYNINIGGYEIDPRAAGAMLLRGAGGLAPGGLFGAGINAATELGAQTIEGRPEYNWPSVAAESALGAIPFRTVGKLGKAVLKGGALGGAGTALRQQTEEGLHIPDIEEGKQIALGAALGGVGGGVAKKVSDYIDTSKFKKLTPKEAANKEVSKAVAQATETKIPDKTPAKATEIKPAAIVAEVIPTEVPSKVPAEPKILMPADLAKAKPKYYYGSREFEPQFENDIDKALYIIARPKKSAAHDKYIKFLQGHLDMDEKELQAAGMEVRNNLKSFLSGQPNDGAIKVPKLYDFKSTPIPTTSKVDIVTGRSASQGVDVVAPEPKPPSAEAQAAALPDPSVKLPTSEVPGLGRLSLAVDPKAPQVELQTAAPPVELGDFSGKPPKKPGPIRRLAAEGRQLQTGLDLSFPFRQGITNVTRKEFWNSMVPMMKSAIKEENFNKFQKEIVTDPSFELMEKAGLEFPGLGKSADSVEEAISRNTLVEKLGVAGIKPIKMSNRAYTAFASKLRKDLFNSMAEDAKKAGVSLIDADGKVNENARAIARYINDSTGRGHLGELEKNAAILNDVVFSPKLMASRVNMFRRAFQDPRMLETGVDTALAKSLRKRAIRDMLGVGGLAATSAGISEMSGGKGTMDPRSTDFGKLKIGNTRLDLTGGFQQYLRVATQIASGQVSTEGQVTNRNRKNTAERFGRNKLSPLAGLVVDWMADKNVLGEKFTWTDAAKDRIIPLIIQDLQELYQEDPKMIGAIVPSMFGVGVQSYSARPTSGRSGGTKLMPNMNMKMPSVKLN